LWLFLIDAGGIPQRIRCDFNSGFVKGKVYAFLQHKGIKVSASPPGHQSQNGTIERQWRTATSMARVLLLEAHMPKRYWFWALRKAVIQMNLLPCQPPTPAQVGPQDHKAGEFQAFDSAIMDAARRGTSSRSSPKPKPNVPLTTPFELFYGLKPDYRTLFQWGCLGYYCRTRDSSGGHSQFDMHFSIGIMLGHSNHTNEMIFWDPVTQRMNVSAYYNWTLMPVLVLTFQQSFMTVK
jgi:transposase InsO family protein